LLDGIPWLFAEPAFQLAQWRQRFHLLLQENRGEQERLTTALKDPAVAPLTAARLQRLNSGYTQHAASLRKLLAPLQLDRQSAVEATLLALRTRAPLAQDLTSYYVNLHRDWVWGARENEASVQLIQDLAADRALGEALVLGAGAGRLAYDIHEQLAPLETVALDLNPLLLIVAARVARGETVELVEFPIAPRDAASIAVVQRLAAPRPARPGLDFVFADALRAPFGDASFDTVVTPWFIDIVPQSLSEVAARVNRLLRPGGAWLNFGSLAFSQRESTQRLGPAEVLATLQSNGFEIVQQRDADLPYMQSPLSRHGRIERVFGFHARKGAEVADPDAAYNLPAWLADSSQPVPLLPHFQTQAIANRIFAFVMALIDGQRSIGEIAAYLVEQRLMQPGEAEPAVRSFLIQLFEESRRPIRF